MRNNNDNKKEYDRAPVYIPFKSFITAIETLGQALPPTLDRSVWPSFSGILQSQTLGAFKFLRLIDDDGNVEPILKRLVEAKGDEKKSILKEIIEKHYEGAIQLADKNVSFHKLQDYFREYRVTGGTLEKVIRFYLDACEYTGLKQSPHWVKAKKTARRPSRKSESQKGRPEDGGRSQPETRPNVKTVHLRSGGTLSLSLDTDFLSLSKEDREWLFGMVDQLNVYEQGEQQ